MTFIGGILTLVTYNIKKRLKTKDKQWSTKHYTENKTKNRTTRKTQLKSGG
jgi:hypothetical protein